MVSSKVANAMATQVKREKANKKPVKSTPSSVKPGQQDLRIELIRTDGGTQSRVALNSETISEYADAMQDGALFPPVTVFYDGDTYWLADGFHRFAAVKRLDLKNILCDVKQGTQREAVLFSVGANAQHGLRRTNDDKRRAVTRLLEDSEWQQWSDREIAKKCGVSNSFVSGLRAELLPSVNGAQMRKATRGGKTYAINTGNIGEAAKAAAKALTEERQAEREARLAEALAKSSPAVVEIINRAGIDDPETVDILNRLEANGSESFDEVHRTLYIQPGNSSEAVHIASGALKVQQALNLKAKGHAVSAIEAKRANILQETAAVALEEGMISVIYANPTWDVVSSSDLADLLDNLQVPITDNAACFIWCPADGLPDGLALLSAWGFDFQTSSIWAREAETFGRLSDYQLTHHEVLLLGTRGEFKPYDRPNSVMQYRTTRTDAKPAGMYSRIEQMYPDQRYLELFAPYRYVRHGWTFWMPETSAEVSTEEAVPNG
jgi:N6-adenosine-specific RNA methylase IME4/ParB-like chromosome segregation protein Spo0J